MRVVALLISFVLVGGAAACESKDNASDGSSDKSAASNGKTMPDVTGKKLDVAENAIESAGGDPDKIQIIGGGTFGVVVKSNWEVCAQAPKAGQALPAAPKLTIERECSESAPVSSSGPMPSSASSGPSEAPLTRSRSKDFAALLKVGDGCDRPVKSFALKYAGRKIEFDGSISALAPHGTYKTRYDISIAPGSKGGQSSVGPNFQFRDVNTVSDLNYKGSVPSSIGVGTKLHLIAEVLEYNSTQCLLFLDPVSTRVKQ